MLLFSMGCQATPTPFAPVPVATIPNIGAVSIPPNSSYTIGASGEVAPHLPYVVIPTEDPNSVDLWIGLNLDETLLPIPYRVPIGLAIDATLPPFSEIPSLVSWVTDATQHANPTLRDQLANLGYPNGIQLYIQIDRLPTSSLNLNLLESSGIFLRPTSADNAPLKIVMGQAYNSTLTPLPTLPLGYTIKEHAQNALRWNAEGLPYLEESE